MDKTEIIWTLLFFSIILHMSLVKKHWIRDYWSDDPVLASSCADKLITCERFLVILTILNVNNNASLVPHNQPAYNVDYLIFYGLHVYIKNKPNKYGLKFYILSDTRTRYNLNAEVYTGSRGNNDVITAFHHWCFDFAKDYLEKGHTIYMNQFYKSVPCGRRKL